MRKFAVILAILCVLSPMAVLPAFAQAPYCPGSLPPQLQVGGRGQIASTFSTLRDSVGGNPIQTVYAPAQFTVLAGPASDGYLCYFQIQYDNGWSGWAVESEVNSAWGPNMYWLTPIAPPPPPGGNPLCPGSLANRLTVGGRGQIASSFSTLRDSVGGNPIQTVYAPAQFTVLAGPASDGYLCYYQIQYDNGWSGWASESQVTSAWGPNMYWLAPLS